MQSVAEVCGSKFALIDIVSVAFVDDDAVGHFHDAALDALQLVACACQLDEQEEVDHRVTGRLALSHTNRLDENLVETSCFA